MCKLLIMTGITEPVISRLFMEAMSIPMSEKNNHGIGYAAVDSAGNLFSEKWRYNYTFFDYDSIMTPDIAKKLKKYENRLPLGALDTNYETTGEINLKDARTVIMHTRFATCEKSLANTHPFIYNNTALIHNGTIRNAFSSNYTKGLDVNKVSTCDSEAALQTYLEEGVSLDTTKARDWTNRLEGSYAFGIIGNDNDGNRILDVVRGSSFLYHMEIEGIGTVFTTDKDDAVMCCKELGLNFIVEPSLVEWQSMYRFDAINGDFVEKIDISKPVVVTNTGNYTSTKAGLSTRYSGRSGSSSSGTSDEKTTDYQKGKEYPSESDAVEFEEFLDRKGKWDYHKVSRYCNNTDNSITDRLDLFDRAYSTNFLNEYESTLDGDLKAHIDEVDFREGFKYARKAITKLRLYMVDAANE